MADELDKRIPELPPATLIGSNFLFAVYDPFTDITKRAQLSDFLPASDGDADQWNPTTVYPEGEIVSYNEEVWVSSDDDNEGNEPFDGSTFWTVGVKAKTGINPWEASIFTQQEVSVYFTSNGELGLYRLENAARPYNSTSFLTELLAGDWKQVSGVARRTVNTAGTDLDMDMTGVREVYFEPSGAIGGNKNVNFLNAASTVKNDFRLTMSGLHTLTFDANVKIWNISGVWDNGTLGWTPDVVGVYDFECKFDQTTWLVKVTGPYT